MARHVLIMVMASIWIMPPGSARAQAASDVELFNALLVSVDAVIGDGSEIATSVEPGDTSALTGLSGVDISIQVRATESGEILNDLPFPVAIPAAGSHTLVVHLGEDDEPTATLFENDMTPTAPGHGRVTFRHAASAGPLDIVSPAGGALASAVSNGTGVGFQLAAGRIDDLELSLTGEQPIVDLPIVDAEAGANVTVYAVGSLLGETFDFFVADQVDVGVDATPVPGQVNTGAPLPDSDRERLFVAAGLLVASAAGFVLLLGRLRRT